MPGRENRSFSAENHRLDLGVDLGFVECDVNLGLHLMRDGVSRLRPVQDYLRDTVVLRNGQSPEV